MRHDLNSSHPTASKRGFLQGPWEGAYWLRARSCPTIRVVRPSSVQPPQSQVGRDYRGPWGQERRSSSSVHPIQPILIKKRENRKRLDIACARRLWAISRHRMDKVDKRGKPLCRIDLRCPGTLSQGWTRLGRMDGSE